MTRPRSSPSRSLTSSPTESRDDAFARALPESDPAPPFSLEPGIVNDSSGDEADAAVS